MAKSTFVAGLMAVMAVVAVPWGVRAQEISLSGNVADTTDAVLRG